jgi:hypothetical protein
MGHAQSRINQQYTQSRISLARAYIELLAGLAVSTSITFCRAAQAGAPGEAAGVSNSGAPANAWRLSGGMR